MSISYFIENDLESRIRSGERPDNLTLEGLAEHYGVSFSPIRAAISSLIAKRLLRKEPNHRLTVITPRKTRQPLTKPERPVDLDALLTREILSVSLNENTTFLREEACAERLKIGRTALRQMLSRLAGKGLVEHVPRRGWRVHSFREDDLCAYLEVRVTLEQQALDLARPNLERDALERMLEWNAASDSGSRLDNQLHRYFIDRSGNRYIQQFFTVHGGYYNTLFDLAAVGKSVVEEMAEQHREILVHVLKRRWARARTALADHIQAQHPISMRLVASIAEQAEPRVDARGGVHQ